MCIRDRCTSALPQQVMELFGAQRCIPTGLQHGTVTVKQSGALYEITTCLLYTSRCV